MSAVAMAFRQFGFENKAFWRNPAAAFFTFLFPLMFLFIFNGLEVGPRAFYVPAIATFSVITACYTNIAMNVSFTREEGVLKRLRGTPLPGWVFLIAKVLHSTFLALILLAIVVAAGRFIFDIDLPTDSVLPFIVTALIGAAAFSALGLALTAVVPNADAAPAVVNGSILPLLFISGVLVDTREAPEWLRRIADIFPVSHYNEAMFAAFTPGVSPWQGTDLLIVALWGVAGLLLATRYFSWEPRR